MKTTDSLSPGPSVSGRSAFESMRRCRTPILITAASLLVFFGAQSVGCNDGEEQPSETDLLCEDYCLLAAECGLPDSSGDCAAACMDNMDLIRSTEPAACFMARRDQLACLVELTCPSLTTWYSSDPYGTEDYPCKDADQAIIDNCQSVYW